MLLKKIGKACVITVAAVILLLVLVIAVLNVAKFLIYSDFYGRESVICDNPGLNDGFVCQGIAAAEEQGKFLISGYMKDKSNSRIYVTDENSNSYYVSLTREGKKYTGHAGGIALTGDRVYIANGSKLYIMSLSDILSAKDKDTLDVGSGVEVNNAASFVYADENYVYVGEYNAPGGYLKDHVYMTPTGENRAIVSRYTHDNLEAPDKIYSIGDYVQGVCFTPDGKIIFSTSHGLTSSVYYVYDEAECQSSEHELDGAAVYFLGECREKVIGPAMGEDLDYFDGKVISLTESASDKYIFGKLFFANDIFALEF